MVTFRSNNSNNNKRPPFRSNNNRRPPFRSNNEGSKFSNNSNFQRRVPGRNNHNASKLIEKYNDLAREALASEDTILSENYFQHAEHYVRVLSEQEKNNPIKPSVDETVKINKPSESAVISVKEDKEEPKVVINN